MLALINLYLPALIPSWRFFKEVAPSPRIEVRINGGAWHAYRRSRPHLSIKETVANLFWNPGWTEHLYLVSCAEKLVDTPTQHCLNEIRTRLIRLCAPTAGDRLQFRLKFLCREGQQIVAYVIYESEPWATDDV